MRATFMYGAGDVRVIDVPDPTLKRPTDALVRIVGSCICGSDLHPYHNMPATAEGKSMGHESLGVVEDVDGMQAEAVRGPLADGTLVTLPVADDSVPAAVPAHAVRRVRHGIPRRRPCWRQPTYHRDSTERPNPAGSSIARSVSRKSQTATAPWTAARR